MDSVQTPTLKLEGVDRSYGSGRGIADVTLSLGAGQICGIIGGNGSGKSTLLHCAAGFERPDRGLIEFNAGGGAQARIVSEPLAAPDAVCLFQNSEPWPHLTVLENVLLPLVRGGRPMERGAALSKARASLSRVGLSDREKGRPASLSGGLRQRLNWARAIALEPKLLFVDEGTSALDPDWTETIRRLLREFAEGGGAVLLVAHQIGFVRRCAHEVLFLHEGRVHEFGAPDIVLTDPQTATLKAFLQNA